MCIQAPFDTHGIWHQQVTLEAMECLVELATARTAFRLCLMPQHQERLLLERKQISPNCQLGLRSHRLVCKPIQAEVNKTGTPLSCLQAVPVYLHCTNSFSHGSSVKRWPEQDKLHWQ